MDPHDARPSRWPPPWSISNTSFSSSLKRSKPLQSMQPIQPMPPMQTTYGGFPSAHFSDAPHGLHGHYASNTIHTLYVSSFFASSQELKKIYGALP